jgi:hypothetical protein
MTAPLVIIGCGARKRAEPTAARELYTGPYFRSCLSTALAIADPGDVLILSARHGFVRLDTWIGPYDVTIGQPGAVTATWLRAQARLGGWLDRPVTALCGARYASLLAEVFTDVKTPLAGLGIGRQRHVLAELRRAAHRAWLAELAAAAADVDEHQGDELADR